MSFPIVEVEISLPGNREHKISLIGDEHCNVNLVSDAARDTNTSFDYSGRHDYGVLPTLKSEGELSLLLTAVMKAKSACDTYLTSIIDEEYGAVGKNSSSEAIDGSAAAVGADSDSEGEEEPLDSKKVKV